MAAQPLKHIREKGSVQSLTRYDLPKNSEMDKALEQHKMYHKTPDWDGGTFLYKNRENDETSRR